ncbi:hypothetical protein E2C01_056324 [Portunus trituberculatus]|uniref:Uncharacterized protein n=1 Tax=Portunus trituberculatus TaxID=210409 RepID=A0A5B7GQ19_PORTR|nr:hypothetical protein [Portunus trituberculatus]
MLPPFCDFLSLAMWCTLTLFLTGYVRLSSVHMKMYLRRTCPWFRCSVREIRRAGSSSLPNYLLYASIRPAGFVIPPRQALGKFWISATMRLRYHEALLLASTPPTMRLRYHEALLLTLAPPFLSL